VELAKDHYFDISAAKNDLGYVPRVKMEDALTATINDLKSRGY
jgi:nucleoside-diphosphate-sugar epimerase